MNKNFNMALIVSIIFLITFAGNCDDPPPPNNSCDWIERGVYRIDGIMKFTHPINPPPGFTSEYRYNPIWGVEEIVNIGGFVVITVTATNECDSEISWTKTYPPADGLGNDRITGVPLPGNGISNVRAEVYSKKFYDASHNPPYVRVLWTKSFTNIDGLHNGDFTTPTIITLDEDQYKAKPLFKDGELQDPV